MKTTVTLSGGKDLAHKLAKLGDEVEGALATAVTAGGHVIRHEASQRAPKDTGTLARSITVEVTTQGVRASASVNPAPGGALGEVSQADIDALRARRSAAAKKGWEGRRG